MHQRGDDARAGGADGMAERAGAAIDVGARVVEAHVAHGRHGDDGESLVHLVQGERRRFPAELRQQFLDRARRRGGEPLGLLREAGVARMRRQRLDSAARSFGRRHQHRGRRAIGNRRRRRGRDRAVLAERGLERRDLGEVDGEGRLVLVDDVSPLRPFTVTGTIRSRTRPS
jgi:hypothetical protein